MKAVLLEVPKSAVPFWMPGGAYVGVVGAGHLDYHHETSSGGLVICCGFLRAGFLKEKT